MQEFSPEISKKSKWISVTPSAAAYSMPFYLTEIGLFYVNKSYAVKRQYHNSFLFLYTLNGSGVVSSDSNTISLEEGQGVIIDCHKPHFYGSSSGKWDFLWTHFCGNSLPEMLSLLYPKGICPLSPEGTTVKKLMDELIELSVQNSFLSASDISARIHTLYSAFLTASVLASSQVKNSSDYVSGTVSYIEANYSRQITVDDMLENAPVSKYYFIKIFKRSTGMTPYSYLLLFRINKAKELLRNTRKTVSEISELCGFLDASNFIVQFKKHTGQNPLKYRNDFLPKETEYEIQV